jgi:hypothetical protein
MSDRQFLALVLTGIAVTVVAVALLFAALDAARGLSAIGIMTAMVI